MMTMATAGEARAKATNRDALVLDLMASDVATVVGGKAAPLARAAKAGHRVPAGFVVTASAFERGLDAIKPVVVERLDALGDGRFAVRSSAVAEDSRERSFAGQLETELDVPRAEVLAAIERCWSSAESLRVLRYGGDPGPIAVIVQKMVPADVAGVAFSADPRTGERGVAIVEAVYGLGDSLVSGARDPEAWRIVGEACERTRGEAGAPVLGQANARDVAQLARAMEALFGCPQDVEWAIANGELFLLQSRPITALPAAPVAIRVEAPEGDWMRDDHHAVLSPLGWDWFAPYPKAMAGRMQSVGVPIKEMQTKLIGGHLYMRMVMPGGGGSGPPPRWLLWLVSRLLPSMRRANQTCLAMLDGEAYMNEIGRWEREIRPEMQRGIRELFVEDARTLDDDALLARIRDALALSARGLDHHAALGGPPMFALGTLALFAADELGWSRAQVFALVAGSSDKTTELHRDIERIIAAHEPELVDGAMPRTWAGLMRTAPGLGSALAEWLRDNRLRVLHYDPKHATLGERPDLVLSIAESIAWSRKHGRQEPAPNDTRAIDEARTKLTPERFERLTQLIANARRAYALRDENGVETVSRPAGLLRYFVLELGRRIEADIGRAEHAVYLYKAEHKAALARTLPDVRALIEKRRGEESWAMRNRGPRMLGKAPPPMTGLDAFPSGLARMMRIFGWTMETENTPDEKPGEKTLRGVGIGTRVVTAKARVIERPEELVSLRHGEVLVCRITSPEWSVALGRVAAIVTNEGGMLSHPAIIAREYDVPAVLGAPNATFKIATGDRVRVDPIEGTVDVIA